MQKYKSRIAIFTDTFLPQINGVVTSLLNIAKSLADRGYYILIVAPAAKGCQEFEYPNIEIKRIFGIDASFYDGFKWTTTHSQSVLKLVKKRHIDLIHFMTPITISYMGIKIAKKLHLPIVGTFHTFIADPAYLQHFIIGTDESTQRATWAYTNLFYNSADLVTSPSPSTNEELEKNGCKSVLKFISNGVDPKKFDNSKAPDFIKEHELTGKTVLFVGRISHEKNLDSLIVSFIKVAKIDKEVKFIIYGDGPYLKEMTELINNEKLQDRFILKGAVPFDDLIKSGVFGACQLFVTASLTENQPMTILEAQANGIVCIGPDARGIPHLILHEKNGLIVEPNNSDQAAEAIIELFSDTEKYKRMQIETHKEVETHHLDKVIDEWDETYNKLIYRHQIGQIKFKKGFSFLLSAIPLVVGLILVRISKGFLFFLLYPYRFIKKLRNNKNSG
jgi:glycosyltransferase involved in cell wall biosynthesis